MVELFYFGVVDCLGFEVSFLGNSRLKLKRSGWITLPIVFLSMVSFVSGYASATPSPGLTRTVYNNRPNGYNQYNASPPMPSITGNPVAGTDVVSRVQDNFDQYPPFGLSEDFMVSYEGYITSPVSGTFQFWPQADDGTKLYIDDVLVQNDWRDKGGGGALSSYVTFVAGVSQKFEMWFYENGGGAWTTLYWDIGSGWQVVPDSAFTTQAAPTTTTTIAPYLNTPRNLQVTSVTDSSVSLSWDAPEESNADVERYAVMWSCETNWDDAWAIASYDTNATINGLESATSCIFQVRADNDTIPVYSNYTASVTGVTETTTTTTTTTTIPRTTTTVQNTTTTIPTTTIPITTTTISDTTTTIPSTIVITTTTEVPVGTSTTSSTEVKVPKPAESSTTTAPPASTTIPLVTTTVPVTTTTVVSIPPQITKEEAVAVATNIEVVKSLTQEQATEVFSAIDINELSPQKAEQLVQAVQDAPAEVREAFEEQVNVFDGAVDTYVPLGSVVDIKTRRVVIAAVTAATSITMTPASGSSPSPQPSNGSGGGGDGDSSNSDESKNSKRRRRK